MDATYAEAIPKADADKAMFEATQHLLVEDTEKLRKVIEKGSE